MILHGSCVTKKPGAAGLFCGCLPLSAPGARQVTLAPEQQAHRRGDADHGAERPPQSIAAVDEGEGLEVHAEEAGDQVQGQEDRSERGKGAHDVVGAVALCREVHLHGGLSVVFQPGYVAYHAFDVLQHVAAAHHQQFVLVPRLGGE